jgi:hypothetical protein
MSTHRIALKKAYNSRHNDKNKVHLNILIVNIAPYVCKQVSQDGLSATKPINTGGSHDGFCSRTSHPTLADKPHF